MPWIEDESYKAMSDDKKDAFHIVLAETFLKSNYMDRQEIVNIGIDHLYFKYSHSDMYERELIEPNCKDEVEQEIFDNGDYDDLPDTSWEFIHDMVIDYICEELNISAVDLDDETVYYRESEAFHEEIFEKSLKDALEEFKPQSLVMDLESQLIDKPEISTKRKI